MPSEFDLALEDFVGELDALLEMATGSVVASMSPRARIAAGNGAVLLLGAMFEEHIRQQVRAAFSQKVKTAADLSVFPDKIAAVVWKRSLERLARRPFDEIEADSRDADRTVVSTLAFCLKKDVTADVSGPLSHNESNMRSVELNRLFNQIGLKNVVAVASCDHDLMKFLGCDNPGKANLEMVASLDAFFRRRNDVAHALQLGTSSGPSELVRDIDLFRTFATALSKSVEKAITPIIVNAKAKPVRKKKAAVANV